MAFPSTLPPIDRALADRKYEVPTPVQLAVLQPNAIGKDLLVSAQTGSGKTVAYGLAMAATLLGDAEKFDRNSDPLALIVAPTRELALQVLRELEWLYANTGARLVSCVGGMDVRGEMRALADGAHIVVGTPGRLRDHLERGRLRPAQLRVVVLDEADEMLDLGFREDLQFILDATPAGRRTLLFSATIPRDIAAMAKRYQHDAVRIDASVKDQAHVDIEYRAVRIAPNEIEHAVVNVLRSQESRAALVFCATRDGVRHLHASLLERGFAAVALSGEMQQNERTQALQSMRDGRSRVCVATDVAARGIDIPGLNLVIHADLPTNREALLHRSGRTGRAGQKGVCVLLVPYTRRRRADQLLSAAGVDAIWGGPPSSDTIRSMDQKRLLHDPALTEAPSEDDLALARLLMTEKTPEQIAVGLARLYRDRLPAPEEVFDNGQPAGESRGSSREPRQEREPRDGRDARRPDFEGKRPGPGDMTWFRMNVGRNKNADPRWLLPLICRLGHVTRTEIGAIRIGDDETRFEITKEAASRFAAAARKAHEKDVQIEPAPEELASPKRAERSFHKPAGRPDFKPGAKPGPRPPHRHAGPPSAERAAAPRDFVRPIRPNSRPGPGKPKTGYKGKKRD